MCLILFAYNHLEQYKLVLITNRDEYHHRKAKQADFWLEQPSIFGGIDCVAGGSWLSVDKAGRLAAVTNVRKPPFGQTAKHSRGDLVKDFLSTNLPASDYLAELKSNDGDFGLFNLLLFDDSGLWHYSSDTHQAQLIQKGIHGVSNATLNTPWPKLKNGCECLRQELNSDELNTENLLNILQSQQKPNDSELPNTGVSHEFEQLLSPIFIRNNEYGTRCSTLITIDQHNTLIFHELSYNPEGAIMTKVLQQIKIDSQPPYARSTL